MLRKTIPFIIIIFLTSCGFHMRESIKLAPPLHTIYVKTADPYGQLARNLRQYLIANGIHVMDKPELATTILWILNEQTSNYLLGISGTQATRQYNLILTVKFELIDIKNNILIEPQIVSESQTLTIKADQILAGSNEADNLYQQMRQAIVYDIMSRLSSQEISTLLTSKNSKK